MTTQKENCIHQLFEEHASAAPEALAVTFGDRQVTYEELNRQSNRIAHALIALGNAPQRPVAMMLDNGPQQISTLFGILKAGAVFVCLDPNYPTHRLGTIIEAVASEGPIFLISDAVSVARHEDLLPALQACGCRLILVDGNTVAPCAEFDLHCNGVDFIDACDDTDPDVSILPEHPAYIVYTSGSTGRPKGIVQSHRSFCQFIEWQSRQFAIVAPERFAQWASIGYDASYCEIFGSLCFGATLCMAKAAVRHDPLSLIQWVREARVSILQMVPSFCRQVVDVLLDDVKEHGGQHPLPDLKALLLSGEALPVSLARAWLHEFPNPPALYNLYGPSESVLATFHRVKEADLRHRTIPIGKAIDGREILFLTERGELCPDGVRGEIYIRSKFLSLGYFRQEKKTREKFLQNPTHNDFDDPVYRTRDIGRRRSDGVIEFSGRNDSMIKLRGFRVELGEIESTILQHPAVSNAVVVARTVSAEGGDAVAGEHTKLVAYFIPVDGQSPAPGSLRHFLRDRLPNFMVPSAFVMMDVFPVNVNGKVDRQALPEPSPNRLVDESTYVAPRNEVELRLVEIWEEILGVAPVGVTDNFFDLGGHSLLAIRLFAAIKKKLGKDVPRETILVGATIEELAATLRDKGWQPSRSELVAIQSRGSATPLFCVPGIIGGVIYLRDLSHRLGHDRPFYALRPQDLHGTVAPVTDIGEMASRFVTRIKEVQSEGPYLLAGHSFGCAVVFETARKLRAAGEEVALLALFDYLDDRDQIWPEGELDEEHFLRNTLVRTAHCLVVMKLVKRKFFKRLCARRRQENRPLPSFLRKLLILRIVNWQAGRDYVPGPYDGKITMFHVEGADVDSMTGLPSCAAGGIEHFTVEGDHDNLVYEPYVADLAAKLSACLERVGKGGNTAVLRKPNPAKPETKNC